MFITWQARYNRPVRQRSRPGTGADVQIANTRIARFPGHASYSGIKKQCMSPELSRMAAWLPRT